MKQLKGERTMCLGVLREQKKRYKFASDMRRESIVEREKERERKRRGRWLVLVIITDYLHHVGCNPLQPVN